MGVHPMIPGFKPMLASPVTTPNMIRFPVYLSEKLDGIRAETLDGKLVSRRLKAIPNNHVRSTLESLTLPDLDGELIVGAPNLETTLYTTSSAVMSRDGKPDFQFYVFDIIRKGIPFRERFAPLIELVDVYPCIKIVTQTLVHNLEELEAYEELTVGNGYEGIMIRSVTGPYKFGRSTENEGWLLKLKRFVDEEAIVIGFEEKYHNANIATKDALGHSKRSSHQANLVPMGTLGALVCESPKYKFQIRVGTGMDDRLRQLIWNNKPKYINKMVTYRRQEKGGKDKPRHAAFRMWRDKIDI